MWARRLCGISRELITSKEFMNTVIKEMSIVLISLKIIDKNVVKQSILFQTGFKDSD